jgi:CubicO group peptidase (beta-lactamase class C family)
MFLIRLMDHPIKTLSLCTVEYSSYNRSMKTRALVLSVLLCLLLTACFGESQKIIEDRPALSPGKAEWPTRRWQVSSLAEQGLNPDLFNEMQIHIDQQNLNLHSLLVVRHGYLVYESYYDGYDNDVLHKQYSCTKSVVSALVGIAIDQGYILGSQEPLLSLLPNFTIFNVDYRKPAITLEDVLTMSAGIDWKEHDPGFEGLFVSPNWMQYMLERPMSTTPGTHFLYCSGCSHLLTGIIAETTGQDVLAFAEENLFKPLGISTYIWDTDPQGIPSGGWGLQMTPRDMAKFGYLYLNRGQWNGQQIISSSWVDKSSAAQIETGGNLGYGYQWWTYTDYGAYMAIGRYGQMIFVIPDSDMVIVTTAQMDNHDLIFDLIDRYIVPSITDG